jgi:predicted  nucleic acid-binding Zn-ribbon protein
MSDLHKSLLGQYKALEKQLTSMESGIERMEDKKGASLLDKSLRWYTNKMADLGDSLNQANPHYKKIEKKLNTVADRLDAESQRISRMRSKAAK